jgi:hypothetical protein
MSTTEITKGTANGEHTQLPLVYADRAMPRIVIAGTLRLLAWDTHRPLAIAAQA